MAYKQLKLWFDKELAIMLADKLMIQYPAFKKSGFVDEVNARVGALELKDRVEVIADLLNEYVPNNHHQTLTGILGPENTEETGMFKKFYWIMPIAKWAEKYGLDSPEESLQLIEEITKRNTGEYAIRPFLISHPALTLNQMKQWAVSDNFHLRRLASEGLRIRLPWAKKMHQYVDNPTPILSIIELLKDDPKKYVQKSVANNLNDLLKENPIAAKAVINSWSKKSNPYRDWIIKHALRNELKKNNEWAKEMIKRL